MIAAELFALPPSLAVFQAHFAAEAVAWAWLPEIAKALTSLGDPPPLPTAPAIPPGVQIEGRVWLGVGVKLPHTCTILGPAWIGPGTEIRPGAFLRGGVITGAGCVLGSACEFKNCLLLDRVQVPHFSYVGDSVLGNGAHLGAGVILSNLRLDQATVTVRLADRTVDTGLRKFGALLGDEAEVGCNAVLNPGSILGRRALVMPLTPFSGTLPAATIARTRTPLTFTPRRD